MRSIFIHIWLIAIIPIISACSFDKPFNREIWLKHNSVEELDNPRARMVEDLLNSHLMPGMSKPQIFELLGTPKFDGIQNWLQKGMVLPDSLSILHSIGKSKEERQKSLDKYNAWVNSHSQPDTIIEYPIGWSTIDPKSLIIKLNEKGLAYEFRIVQH